MSKTTNPIQQQAASREAVMEQLRQFADPHTSSAQAAGDVDSQRHSDGQHAHKRFSIPPFHKYIARCERAEKAPATFPSALVGAMVHVREREIELLEKLADRDAVTYRHDDPHPSHDALESYPRLRGKMLEWLADDRSRVKKLVAGGRDLHTYGSPGSGKSTWANFYALTDMQVNDSTVIWADTLDESGTNERTEWLPMAPYATIALPEGLPVNVRLVPEDTAVDPFEVPIRDICRDVVRYSSPEDLLEKLLPGGFYVVYPDPLLRGCQQYTQHAYHRPVDVTDGGEEGPSNPTPADHWWFAFLAARIVGDHFLHPTTVNLDEAGNLLDPDASRDEHDHYDKIVWLKDKYADARKKHVTLHYQSHYIHEIHPKLRAKMRWWLTMNGMSPPLSKTLPGDKKCPMQVDYVSAMDKGQGQIWRPSTQRYASINWPNLKRDARLDAEISLEFPTWTEARRGEVGA